MANKIICIAREFGSGGHEIAVRTGARLGIRVYEKDLFHLACRYGELSEKMMESADETATNPFLYQTVHEGNYHVTRGLPTSRVLFELQSHEIRHIAARESCIFVGRCADYVLREADVKLLKVLSVPRWKSVFSARCSRKIYRMRKRRVWCARWINGVKNITRPTPVRFGLHWMGTTCALIRMPQILMLLWNKSVPRMKIYFEPFKP